LALLAQFKHAFKTLIVFAPFRTAASVQSFRLEQSLQVRQDSPEGTTRHLEGILRYREVEDEVKGTTLKHRIAGIHAEP
jgi:hypothetical protein